MNTINKVAWVHIKDRKALFARSKGKDAFYNPGGKMEKGESEIQAVIREIKEEVNVDLIPETVKYLETFKAQAHGKPEGVFVEIKCYTGDYVGALKATTEIEELAWLTSKDMERTTPAGKLTLSWLKEHDLID